MVDKLFGRSILSIVKPLKTKARPRGDGSMRELAYAHIQRKIASRELRAGTPVSELPIANELKISRTPTREALRQLITEGLLEEVPGRGAVVARLEREDIVDLYDLREALELHAVRTLAARTNAPEELAALQKVTDEMLHLINELDRLGTPVLDDGQMQHFESSDIGFHIALLRMAGNRRSLKVVNQARQLIRIFAMRRGGHDRLSLERIYRHHCDIVRAIALRKPDEACAVVSAHIQDSRRERLEQYEQWERNAALDRGRVISIAG